MLDAGDVPDRFEDVHGIFQEAQDVGWVYVDPELIKQITADLPMIEPVFPKLDEEPGEHPLRAPAEGGVPAFAFEKCIKEREQLLSRGRIELIKIEF